MGTTDSGSVSKSVLTRVENRFEKTMTRNSHKPRNPLIQTRKILTDIIIIDTTPRRDFSSIFLTWLANFVKS